MTVRLYQGTVHVVGGDLKTAQNATFRTYDITLDTSHLSRAKRRGKKHRKEMYLEELLAEMERTPADTQEGRLLTMEFQQRFAYPFACLVMALIGVPLGTHWRGGRSWGTMAALVVFLAYYLMLSLPGRFPRPGCIRPTWVCGCRTWWWGWWGWCFCGVRRRVGLFRCWTPWDRRWGICGCGCGGVWAGGSPLGSLAEIGVMSTCYR